MKIKILYFNQIIKILNSIKIKNKKQMVSKNLNKFKKPLEQNDQILEQKLENK